MIAVLAALALAAPCSTTGTPPFVAPSNICTPGAFVRKTKTDVCDGQTVRPSLPAAERRAILSNYGVPTFNGATGELDHRQPLALGGTTDRRNIWPQIEVAGFNPKDRLEGYVFRRVCKSLPHPMSLHTAHAIFAGNWVAYFRFYRLG